MSNVGSFRTHQCVQLLCLQQGEHFCSATTHSVRFYVDSVGDPGLFVFAFLSRVAHIPGVRGIEVILRHSDPKRDAERCSQVGLQSNSLQRKAVAIMRSGRPERITRYRPRNHFAIVPFAVGSVDVLCGMHIPRSVIREYMAKFHPIVAFCTSGWNFEAQSVVVEDAAALSSRAAYEGDDVLYLGVEHSHRRMYVDRVEALCDEVMRGTFLSPAIVYWEGEPALVVSCVGCQEVYSHFTWDSAWAIATFRRVRVIAPDFTIGGCSTCGIAPHEYDAMYGAYEECRATGRQPTCQYWPEHDGGFVPSYDFVYRYGTELAAGHTIIKTGGRRIVFDGQRLPEEYVSGWNDFYEREGCGSGGWSCSC
jgi:hypothetical protein